MFNKTIDKHRKILRTHSETDALKIDKNTYNFTTLKSNFFTRFYIFETFFSPSTNSFDAKN